MEGPQVTLDERLAERRARIQKRLDAERGTTSDPAADGKKLDANRLGEERAQKARKAMASTHSEAVNAVSLFNVKANTMEEERREKNEVFTDSRRQKRAEEVADCEVRHGALSMQFEALYRHKVPHELHTAMEEQKKNCQELLGIKSKLVDELQMQLEDAEDSYVGLLRRNGADVKDLVMAMKNKSQEYQDHYSSELCEVEKAYMEERKNLLDQYSQDIQQLVKTRRTKETDYRKRREAKIMEAQMKLDNKYEESYEEFNKLKSEHLDEIHALRQEREKCKPDFMLNAERLSYNLQVLRERVKENKSAQNQYKRKLARLQNTLSTLVARHQESERKFQRANKDLTSQLHRVDVQYKDLQAKFQLFEKADKEKYRQLWNMHDQKCRHLVHRSLQADRVVFEDILSMPWSPPEMAFWPEEQEDMDGVDEEEQDDEVPEELELSEPAAMLFQILKSQATFLVDDNVRAAIAKIEGTTEEQAAVEGILTTLHISKKEDVEDLLEYFMVESDDESVALINPQEAIRALNAYLEERNASSKKAKDSAESQSPLRNKTKVKARQRERRLAAERNYWKQLSLCVPEDHLQVWRALEKGLEQYLAQLQLRRGLISDTDKLRVQNSELRGLLMQYQQTTGRMLM